MSDLISRDAVYDALDVDYLDCAAVSYEYLCDLIAAIPAEGKA